MPEFLTNDVLECAVNPTYLIESCNCNTVHENIGNVWGDIIYDTWNRELLTIHFLDSSSWKVLYNPPLFYREMHLQRLIYFVYCNLFLTFTFCDFCIPIKSGFQNIPPLYKQTRCTFIRTLCILFYQFYSFMWLQIFIIIIIIIIVIIITVVIIIIFIFLISFSSFLIILTFTVSVFILTKFIV